MIKGLLVDEGISQSYNEER